jgi:hypothetical protein
MSATTDAHASDIIATAKIQPLSEGDQRKAAEVGVAAALGESSLLMYANDGSSTDIKYGTDPPQQLTQAERDVARQSLQYPHDKVGNNLDSMGLFQQRPSSEWGYPNELMDARTSADKFFNGANWNKGLLDLDGWQSMSPGDAAWTVQQCAPEDKWIYDQAGPQATEIVNRLWDSVDGGDDMPYSEDDLKRIFKTAQDEWYRDNVVVELNNGETTTPRQFNKNLDQRTYTSEQWANNHP